MTHSRRIFFSLLLVFFVCSSAIYFSKNWLTDHFTDWRVLFGANFLFILLAFLSIMIQVKTTGSTNANAYVRAVLSGMMLKMFAVVAAVIIYVFTSGDGFNKRAVFASMLLYLVYLFTEVYLSMKAVKGRKSNG